MKAKTSLTLSEELVAKLDRLAGPKVSRSAFIEQVLRDFVEGRAQAAINRHAAKLNAEMKDALSLQADIDDP
jgi:metal-responsive CopG/Arc/MetJ family transcriptional regulator